MSARLASLVTALCAALVSGCNKPAAEERISCSSRGLGATVLEQGDRLYFVLVNSGCKSINAPDGIGLDTLNGTFIVSDQALSAAELIPPIRPTLDNAYVELKARGVYGTVVTKHEAREAFNLPQGCQTVHVYYVVNSSSAGHPVPEISGSNARICL